MSGSWTPARRAAEVGAWTAERRVAFDATIARKRAEREGRAAKLSAAARALIDGRAEPPPDAFQLIDALTKRVAALEAWPRSQIIEWRPDHRRQADGGRPVRGQRRAVGLPKRLPRLQASA